MPRRASSGTKGLLKHHKCGRPGRRLTRCACQWIGKYQGRRVVLSKWAGQEVDPHSTEKAEAVLARFKVAIDGGTFDRAGERPAPGTAQTLAGFIAEWQTHYAAERGLSANSMGPMLNVLATSRLGGLSLKQLADAAEEIERWLNVTGKARKWKNSTWNNYHEILGRVLKRAVRWKRLTVNPMASIDRKVAAKPEHFKQRHLVEDVEDRLFDVVDQLNRPQHFPNRKKLTQEQADAIRAALERGQTGKAVAAEFQISPSVVSAIKNFQIWDPERLKPGTKGHEMRRRLIGALDGGLRAGEMLKLQLHHVTWRPVPFTRPNGTTGQGYVITLPPEITKGGKSTGEPETVFAGTPRFVQMLEQRRFQLQGNKLSRTFIFGSEDGRYQASFDRLWRELFTLAGLVPGRAQGLVWHTTRHEFISRVAENTGDPVLTQEVARHRDLETTQGYFHARQDRRYAAAGGLWRG